MTPRMFLRVLTVAAAGAMMTAGCTPPPQQTQVAAVDQSWPDRDERMSARERREMQRLLRSLGHEPGGVDGVVGPRTREAISDYQAATRRRADGVVSSELLAALRADAGVRAPVVARPRTVTPRPVATRPAVPRQPAPVRTTARQTPPPVATATEPAPAPQPTPAFTRNERPEADSGGDSGGWN